MKIKLMLKAAAITEKADPIDFNMSNVNQCILGQCAKSRDKDFAMLRPILDYADYEPLAAECFGIDVEMVDYLFGAGSGNYLTGPIEAAARVRRVVAEHKKRLARKKAARARKRAEYIRLAKQIRMSPKAGMTAITTAVSDALAKVKEPV